MKTVIRSGHPTWEDLHGHGHAAAPDHAVSPECYCLHCRAVVLAPVNDTDLACSCCGSALADPLPAADPAAVLKADGDTVILAVKSATRRKSYTIAVHLSTGLAEHVDDGGCEGYNYRGYCRHQTEAALTASRLGFPVRTTERMRTAMSTRGL